MSGWQKRPPLSQPEEEDCNYWKSLGNKTPESVLVCQGGAHARALEVLLPHLRKFYAKYLGHGRSPGPLACLCTYLASWQGSGGGTSTRPITTLLYAVFCSGGGGRARRKPPSVARAAAALKSTRRRERPRATSCPPASAAAAATTAGAATTPESRKARNCFVWTSANSEAR
jgi:hypothetical protein